jgi:NAD(P)H-dependent FMN reductase
MNIKIVSGSPRAASVTVRVAKYLKQYLTENHSQHSVGLIDVREWKLGQLQNVFNSVTNTPDEFKPLAEKMFSADAFIIVTPEYNGTYSSDVKNLFDHFPKQVHKAFGLVTASVGALGGARCTQTLLVIFPK